MLFSPVESPELLMLRGQKYQVSWYRPNLLLGVQHRTTSTTQVMRIEGPCNTQTAMELLLQGEIAEWSVIENARFPQVSPTTQDKTRSAPLRNQNSGRRTELRSGSEETSMIKLAVPLHGSVSPARQIGFHVRGSLGGCAGIMES